MKTSELYQLYRRIFREQEFESPDLEAAWLLEEILQEKPGTVPCSVRPVTEDEESRARLFLDRRLRHEPYQYIFGHASFRDLELLVGPGCLIPRPETEVLVDHILSGLPHGASVCELGTGSGAIALSLASERPDLAVCASELSANAFAWAVKNRERLHLERVRLEQGDLFEPFGAEQFDVIAANLPYIAEWERRLLPRNVRDFEPDEALFAPDGGFALILRAIMEAPMHLRPHGRIFLEIGEEQGARCLDAAVAAHYRRSEIRVDQYGAPRFFIAGV